MPRQCSNDNLKAALTQRRAAAVLGVRCDHLNRVLRGHRIGRRLTVLYRELMRLAAVKPKVKVCSTEFE